jgi:hypothetical protein
VVGQTTFEISHGNWAATCCTNSSVGQSGAAAAIRECSSVCAYV